MTKDEYDEKLEVTQEALKESLAAKAVNIALEEVLVKVLKKHKLRKDSWHHTTSVFAMLELAHNKMHRLKEIYAFGPSSPILTPELVKEANDELDDIIAYCTFQKYVLNVDKQLNVQVTAVPEDAP